MSDQPQAHEPLEPPQDAVAPAASPPLSIVHFFLWMAGSAVYLSIERFVYSFYPDIGVNLYPPERLINSTLVAIAVGPGIASWAIFAWRRFHGMRFPAQPGEWLLLIAGANSVCTLLSMGATFLSAQLQEHHGLWHASLAPDPWFAATAMFSCLFFVAATYCVRRPATWMVVYALLIVQNVPLPMRVFLKGISHRAPSFFGTAHFITDAMPPSLILGVLPLLALTIAITMDVRHRRRRGWLHWTGVAVYVSTSLLELYWRI